MNDTAQPNTPPHGMGISVMAQYTKDLSFENPNILKTFSEQKGPPEINVNVHVHGQPAGDNIFEVTLVVEAKASYEKEMLFLVELTYAGLFNISGVKEEDLKPLLLIECPRLLFPFARNIVADVTRDGGMPPLLLNPVDFSEMYRQQHAEQGGKPH